MRCGDRWFIVSSGPFQLKPGEPQTIRAVKIISQGNDNLESITLLKKHAHLAQDFHDRLFSLTETAKPLVILNFQDKAPGVHISWNDLSSTYSQNGLQLLGYKLYQQVDSSLIELAAFDAKDGITEIRETVDGQEQLLYSGDENGMATFFYVQTDKATDNPLHYGYTYSFLLKAFVHDPAGIGNDRVITNDPEPIAYTYLPDNYRDAFYAWHTASGGNGIIQVINHDPKLFNNDHYKITFEGSVGDLTMALDNTTKGQRTYYDKLPDEVFNSILFDSLGFQLDIYSNFGIDRCTEQGTRWMTGYNWSNHSVLSGLYLGHNFYGSTVPYKDLVPVRINFQDAASVAADGYWSKGAVYRRDLGYTFSGIGDLPMAAYDTSDPLNPRKLNICFIEDKREAPADNLWNMGWDGTSFPDPDHQGAQERLFFMNSNYNEGAYYNDDNNGMTADVLYGFWPTQYGSHPYLEAKFSITIFPSLGFSSEDVFEFNANLLQADEQQSAAPQQFILFQNFPNPFNNQTTIRYELAYSLHVSITVYNIMGQEVAQLVNEKKDVGLHQIVWNAAEQPTGIYFVRLTAGEEFNKIVKALIVK